MMLKELRHRQIKTAAKIKTCLRSIKQGKRLLTHFKSEYDSGHITDVEFNSKSHSVSIRIDKVKRDLNRFITIYETYTKYICKLKRKQNYNGTDCK